MSKENTCGFQTFSGLQNGWWWIVDSYLYPEAQDSGLYISGRGQGAVEGRGQRVHQKAWGPFISPHFVSISPAPPPQGISKLNVFQAYVLPSVHQSDHRELKMWDEKRHRSKEVWLETDLSIRQHSADSWSRSRRTFCFSMKRILKKNCPMFTQCLHSVRLC